MDNPSTLRKKLDRLARNLWWSWQPEVTGLFRDLNPSLWARVNHNPVAFLAEVEDSCLAEQARNHALGSQIHAAFRRLDRYLTSRDTWGASNAGMLKSHPVAYFSAEFGIHESLPLYSGGLGVLSGDHLKAASDLDIPIIGVGMFYAQGYFTQRLDASGWQQEDFGTTDIEALPLERVTDSSGNPLLVQVLSGSSPVMASLWRADVGRCQLVLLDTDVDGNSDEFRQITSRLYWGDQAARILQEMLLGIGGLRALKLLGIRPNVYHLNEGHSAFALLEAIRMEMVDHGQSFEEAAHRVGSHSVFTTHTPVPAGHDRFPPEMIRSHLGWLQKDLGLDESAFMGLGRVDPSNSKETFCMTVLALKLAHRANGVASVHGDVSRRMWKDLWPGRSVQEVPIGHVTNGVHTRSWMAPQFVRFLESKLGSDWGTQTAKPDMWRQIESISTGELWEHHEILKADLITFVRKRYEQQELRRGVPEEVVRERATQLLDPDALTLAFARRFATYKRATLMFRDAKRLRRLMSDPDRPIQIVFAGKAHPRDDGGKGLIQNITNLAQEEGFSGRMVFIEDYDINVARHLVQGVDVWVNNPVRPEEACGTSGMKAMLNGALNLSIKDGWWAEAYDGLNGFDIVSTGPHKDPEIQDEWDHQALMGALEHDVIPLYYERDDNGLPARWIDRMKWAFMTLAWRYSADRMVKDYVTRAYLPAALGDSCRMPDPS